MKRVLFLIATIVMIFISCNNNEEQSPSFEFCSNKSVKCDIIEKGFVSDVTLDLENELADFSLIQLFFNDEDIFISSLTDVIRFGKNGTFKNRIGKIGHAAEEYTEMVDCCIDPSGNVFEVLGPNSIYKYDIMGNFISKTSLPIPATSFVKTDKYYWFSTGRNGYDKFSLFRTDHMLKDTQKYIEAEGSSLPIKEKNFGKGTYLTYKESFTHDVHKITNGNVELDYRFRFAGLEIPKGMFDGDLMTVVQKLSKQKYAMIHTYLENDDYIFMLVQQYNKGMEEEPVNYWWIINKQTKKDIVINIPVDEMEIYGDPQILSDKNILYIVGFPYILQKNDDNEASNPHVLGVNISKII